MLNKKSFKKPYVFWPLSFLILGLSIFGISRLAWKIIFQAPVEEVPIITENPELSHPEIAEELEEEIEAEVKEEEILENKTTIPEKFLNPVAFTSQAPYAKWDELHDEACEEASMIIAHYYLKDETKI